jgi:hypothetical protein
MHDVFKRAPFTRIDRLFELLFRQPFYQFVNSFMLVL